MSKGDYLGEFEHLVLLAIARAGGKSGGADIHAEIERVSRRGASLPAIYVTLGRLENKGYVCASETVAQEGRGGRPRRLFELTRAGSTALRATREVLERMWVDVPPAIRSRR
jgi:PadR family transcriptional regulator, regulatory protein PadR